MTAAEKPFGMDTNTLAQIALERNMFSMNAIDGVWGSKSNAALAAWQNAAMPDSELCAEQADVLARTIVPPYRLCRVTAHDYESLVAIPATPAEKMQLPSMGYETILEKYAELGHTTQAMMRKLKSILACSGESAPGIILPSYFLPVSRSPTPTRLRNTSVS